MSTQTGSSTQTNDQQKSNVNADTKMDITEIKQPLTIKCDKDHIYRATSGDILPCCPECLKERFKPNNTTSDNKTHTNTIEHPVSSVKSIVGYISCSSKKQMFVYSILRQQIEDIKKYAARYELPVTAIYRDESCDDSSLEGRPEFTKCLAEIKHGQELVYCQPKNLVNNLFQTLKLSKDLRKRKISLKCLMIPGSIYRGDDEFLFHVSATIAEYMNNYNN